MEFEDFESFRALVSWLEQHTLEHFDLDWEQNPVVKCLYSLSAGDIKKVIQEYSQFSNEAIHMLLDARLRVHEWGALREEIDHNIEEEKGLKTKDMPHLEIMRLGYQIGLGFDVNSYEPSEITKTFLSDMRKIFRVKNNAYIAGALLAFESVSIPEFYVLDSLVGAYHYKVGLTKYNSYLEDYIEGHKHFEVGHKEGLIKATERYIGKKQSSDFTDGYLAVCETMSKWWTDLHMMIVKEKL